nr:hypothetical protein CFP56_45518 [Quercus suber]
MVNTGAIDLGFIGPSFTWSNRREGLANIKEKLDQCLCDQEWQTLFPKAGVRHLCNSNSDHNLIMLDTHLDSSKWPCPFRFEAMWTKEEGSRRVVEGAWQTWVEGSHGFKLAKKFEVLLRLINREVDQKRLSGVKVSNTAPPISKLCYADDIILFCKAKSSELATLKVCLEKYYSWSG